jgi:hypothetical protein
MKHFAHRVFILVAIGFTAGCREDQPQEQAEPQPQAQLEAQPQPRPKTADGTADAVEAQDRSGEREAIDALKQLGANVALDERGRAKVLRLTGPKITDAELKHVAALTELRALYLDGTQVTDAGMGHLEPLRKLETLRCLGNITTAKARMTIEELKAATDVEFVKCPLADVLDVMGDMHAIPFNTDEAALKAADRSPADPVVTAKHENVVLGEALTSILEPLGLVWTIEGGAVLVTTEQALAERRPHLAKLREAVSTLKDVLVDFQAAPKPASEP